MINKKEKFSAERDEKKNNFSQEVDVQKVHYEEFTYEKPSDESKQVFIDLDDAYGIPFSSGAFVMANTTKQNPKKS